MQATSWGNHREVGTVGDPFVYDGSYALSEVMKLEKVVHDLWERFDQAAASQTSLWCERKVRKSVCILVDGRSVVLQSNPTPLGR
jgi:hypothetical protein